MNRILLTIDNLHSSRVLLPASKSISNRALVIDALANDDFSASCGISSDWLINLSDCDDTRVMIEWFSSVPGVIDIGAAGTAMRFSTAFLSVMDGEHTITGSARMKQRPISVLVDALRSLGCCIDYVENEGFPPLRIKGNNHLEGGMVRLSGSVSSQYISALLMIGPKLTKGLHLVLEGEVVSRPYIDMTINMMRDYGAEVEWKGVNEIVVSPVPYKRIRYAVESDWSAASYWYEMLALSKSSDLEFKLLGLHSKSLQGDSEVANIFRQLGVETEFRSAEGNEYALLRKSGYCTEELCYDFTCVPDLAQTLVVTCAMLGIKFNFTGLQSLKIKETDRIVALQNELAKIGVMLKVSDSTIEWDGAKSADALQAGNTVPAIDTYDDHRMAMSFAPCALVMPKVVINAPQVVTKSYPTYWEQLERVGFNIAAL